MTEDDVAIVRESWACVTPQAEAAMHRFYSLLFETNPTLAHAFSRTDMKSQQLRLASAINLVVENLHQSEVLAHPLQELGARHAGYAVAEHDFGVVGQTLLTTLASELNELWSDKHEEAWAAAWAEIATQVLRGFHAQRAA